MVKKLSGKAGMTLLEMMVALLILVLLVSGMGTGMTAGLRVYEESAQTTSRTMLAADINSRLTDMLRYAEVRKTNSENAQDPAEVITNLEFGLLDAYFTDKSDGILKVCFWADKGVARESRNVISAGAYNGMKMDSFELLYNEKGYFTISYHLLFNGDTKSVENKFEAVVRVMNY